MNTLGASIRSFLLLLTLCAGSASAQSLTLGAIGDSISSGFNTVRIGDNRDASWTTGTRPESDSHLKKLKALTGKAVVGRNEAVAGSTVYDLDSQITRVLTRSPDFLTLTIGANDICAWSEDHENDLQAFKDKLEGQLTRITEAQPAIKIYLSAIPDMYNLWEVAAGRSGCQARWDLFNICPVLLGRNQTDAGRAAFAVRWRDANAAIADLATQFADNVYHDPSMSSTRFEWEHVSGIDCFHPSVSGQNLLSEMVWQGGWIDPAD